MTTRGISTNLTFAFVDTNAVLVKKKDRESEISLSFFCLSGYTALSQVPLRRGVSLLRFLLPCTLKLMSENSVFPLLIGFRFLSSLVRSAVPTYGDVRTIKDSPSGSLRPGLGSPGEIDYWWTCHRAGSHRYKSA